VTRVRAVVLFAGVLASAACARDIRPSVPETVTVVVERYRKLPAWATEPLRKPEAVNGTVGARLQNEEARGMAIDVANCHRRLLMLLDIGQAVDEKECEQ